MEVGGGLDDEERVVGGGFGEVRGSTGNVGRDGKVHGEGRSKCRPTPEVRDG